MVIIKYVAFRQRNIVNILDKFSLYGVYLYTRYK